MLGLPALYKDDGSGDGVEHGFDLLALVNGTSELLNLYQATMAKLGDMEEEDARRSGELDYLRMRHGRLKVRASRFYAACATLHRVQLSQFPEN